MRTQRKTVLLGENDRYNNNNNTRNNTRNNINTRIDHAEKKMQWATAYGLLAY